MSSAIGQLLVHLDSSGRSSARLEFARALAQQHGASLAAQYAATPSIVALPYGFEGGAGLAVQMRELDDERRIRARAAFDESMKRPGTTATWSDSIEFGIIDGFARQALYADLMVLGQFDYAQKEMAEVPVDFVESVMVASGKAAIVVPWAGAVRDPGGTVVIAWKETAQSARAVAAAMPLLQRAGKVHVVTWAEEQTHADTGRSAALSLDSYLRAHKVEAVWHHQGDEPSHLGELLLSTVFDLDAGLLVMGCYGHSRAREWVLGGVSRTILESMTLPVLMAH
ncbi:MAG: universal stress protein [Ramlibacter sp.]